jgi:lipopolysaccharide export LptBFGC system permease protein LptF
VLWKALQDYYTEGRTPLEMSTGYLNQLVRTIQESGGRPYELETQLQFRYSIPLACLVFVLLAAPLADRWAHRGAFVGILIAVLIVFLYNGVRSWGLAFGMAGAMNPVLAAWMQNLIFGGLGIWLMWRHR